MIVYIEEGTLMAVPENQKDEVAILNFVGKVTGFMGEKPTTVTLEANGATSVKRHNYRCNQCDKVFQKKRGVIIHKARMHRTHGTPIAELSSSSGFGERG